MSPERMHSSHDGPRPPRVEDPACQRVATSAATQDLDALLCAISERSCQVAFKRLHDITSKRLSSIVRRVTRDAADVEDVVQEVYMKVWRFCHRFDRTRGPAQAWMSRIAHHHALSSLRLRSARPPLQGGKIDDENPYEHVTSPGPGPEDLLIDTQRKRAVSVCLLALPKGQREALALAFFDELSHREVAERLSRPLGTVKSSVRRGMRNMNATLEAHR